MAETEYFGVVGWCERDIADAIVDQGFAATPDAISAVKKEVKHGYRLVEAMIDTGWSVIYAAVHEVLGKGGE